MTSNNDVHDAVLVADESAAGTYAAAISNQRLTWAVQELARLGSERLSHLKIRSGEHLAAILVTAFLAVPPHELDTDGGVDLLFRLDPDSHPGDFFPSQPLGAFEVKSAPGPFRKVDDGIDRTLRKGDDASGMGVSVLVEHAADILQSAMPILRSIATILVAKLSAKFRGTASS